MNSSNSPSPNNAHLLVVLSGASAESTMLAWRYAATAAAMDVPVEVHVVSAGAVRWLARGEAGAALLTQIRQACDLGVGLFACPAALAELGLETEQLIAEVEGVRGAASLVSAAMAPHTRVLSF